jgi:hypothetical protein
MGKRLSDQGTLLPSRPDGCHPRLTYEGIQTLPSEVLRDDDAVIYLTPSYLAPGIWHDHRPGTVRTRLGLETSNVNTMDRHRSCEHPCIRWLVIKLLN